MDTLMGSISLFLPAGAAQDPGYVPYSAEPHLTYGILYPTFPHAITVPSESNFTEVVFVEDHDKWVLEFEPYTITQFASLNNAIQYTIRSGTLNTSPSVSVPSSGRRQFSFSIKAKKVTQQELHFDEFRFIDMGPLQVNDGTTTWLKVEVTIVPPQGQGNEPPGGGSEAATPSPVSEYAQMEDGVLWFGHS